MIIPWLIHNDKSQSLQTMYINQYIIKLPKLHQHNPWSTNINKYHPSPFTPLQPSRQISFRRMCSAVFCTASSAVPPRQGRGVNKPKMSRMCQVMWDVSFSNLPEKMVKCMPKTTPLLFFFSLEIFGGSTNSSFWNNTNHKASIEGATGNPQRWTPAHVPTKHLCPMPNQSKHPGTYLYISKVNKLIHPK